MEKLKNKSIMPVIDHLGYFLETQEDRDTPLYELFPNEDVVLILWIAEGSNLRPSVEELQRHVIYKWKAYHGHLDWFG